MRYLHRPPSVGALRLPAVRPSLPQGLRVRVAADPGDLPGVPAGDHSGAAGRGAAWLGAAVVRGGGGLLGGWVGRGGEWAAAFLCPPCAALWSHHAVHAASCASPRQLHKRPVRRFTRPTPCLPSHGTRVPTQHLPSLSGRPHGHGHPLKGALPIILGLALASHGPTAALPRSGSHVREHHRACTGGGGCCVGCR